MADYIVDEYGNAWDPNSKKSLPVPYVANTNINVAPQYNKDPRLERPAFLNNQREGLWGQQQEFVGPKATKMQLAANSLKNSPFAKGAGLGGGIAMLNSDDPTDWATAAISTGVGNKVLDMASNAIGKTKYGKAIKNGGKIVKNLAGKLPGAAAVSTAGRFVNPVIAGGTGVYLLNKSYDAKQDIDAGKDNAFVGNMRKTLAPIYGFDNFLRSDDKKGFQGYLDAVKEEYNQGIEEAKRADVKAQIAQEEAKRAAEQQPTRQAVPKNASWEQQRAAQAQAMAQSVKDNPDNPYAWDAAPGFGAVRGSNGEMKYVVPNEPYNPDKAYEQAMRDQAYQYYMDAISMAGSPFATPERRASELARANSLAQAFGLGLSPDVAAMGGGGGLRAGQLSTEAKNAQALYLKGEENKRNQNADVRKHIMDQAGDNPEIGLRAVTAFDAANNYDNINPLDEGQMQRKRGEQMSEGELNLMMQQMGANGGKVSGIYKKNPWGGIGETWNTWAPFDWMMIDPNYYVESNGKQYEFDDSKFSAGAKFRADLAARRNLDQESLNKQYAEYRANGGNLPFQTWLQQFYMGN